MASQFKGWLSNLSDLLQPNHVHPPKRRVESMNFFDEEESLKLIAKEIGPIDSPLHCIVGDGIHVSFSVRHDKKGGISLCILIVIVYPNVLLLCCL